MKRYLAILGAAMFFVACFSLYLMMESVSSGGRYEIDGIPSIEDKIKQIEADLQRNHKTINIIKDTVRDFAQKGDKEGLARLEKVLGWPKGEGGALLSDGGGAQNPIVTPGVRRNFSRTNVPLTQEMCSFAEEVPKKTDIQMVDVFDTLPFDNPDGGVWKQGFPITYSKSQWDSRPLMVYVVPHSHNDPGWLKTFERYYSDQTRLILNNMVDKLEQYPKMRFIYAEMSFFSMWWKEIDASKRQRVKTLLDEKRLEIVTGGWVMTDEANAHYFAMLDQLIEGNQWLKNQVGVTPQSGWAIDPFGHSSTMPYLLQGAGFHNMLIQRIHYSVKKHLAQSKQLEFMWRQNWDHRGTTDMFTHMMPFYSYDVPHTCGPEPAVCCQFDFKRLPGGKISCPWKVAPTPITDQNVEQKAFALLDQYRKKSTLYNNAVVLIPLGDDFRYDKTLEWDQQYNNYQKLFDYMNTRKDWNVQAQFGTLSDYFHALHYRAGSQPGTPPPGYPVLGGDFFTYSDRDDQYWSGYYTSRPFYKRLDRELEAHLRGAEVAFSLAVAQARHLGSVTLFPESALMSLLVTARRALGLYQHHDGITGTAKDAVVVDYGNKMLDAIKKSKHIIKTAAEYLLLADKSTYTYNDATALFDVDEERIAHDAVPDKTLIVLNKAKQVAFYNSLAHSRQTVVRIYVSSALVEVKDGEGHTVQSQCDPYWISPSEIATDKFKLSFVVTVPALGLATYTVRTVDAGTNPNHSLGAVYIYNGQMGVVPAAGPHGAFNVIHKTEKSFVLESADIKATISADTGTLKDIVTKEDARRTKTEVEFLAYGTTSAKEKSGAYLFLPDGNAKPLTYNPPVMRVIIGPLMSQVLSALPNVEHSLAVYNSPGLDGLSVDILNLVDIRGEHNRELVMRVHTDIQNHDTFYTDLNGFQIQKRKTYSKLPLQANYYPMPTMAYLQDDTTRFSVLSAQSLGCASLQLGALEVMQDRRLNQDDNRGLAQGVQDNKRTPNRFRLLVERRQPGAKPVPDQPVGYPSLISHLASQEFIHPTVTLPESPHAAGTPATLTAYKPLRRDLSCDLHVVTLRTIQRREDDTTLRFTPRDDVALILHRLGVDCSFGAKALMCPMENGQVAFSSLFEHVSVKDVAGTSLTLLHDESPMGNTAAVQIPTMEIKAYKLTLK